MYGIGVHGPTPPRPSPMGTAAGPMAPAPPAAPAVAPGLSDAGAATVLELQKPRLPPIHTPFTVFVLPSTTRPSAVRGAGWLAVAARACC